MVKLTRNELNRAFPTAIISDHAEIDKGVKHIGMNVNIYGGVRVVELSKICDGVSIGAGSTIGRNVDIENNVIIYAGCLIDSDVTIRQGSVIHGGVDVMDKASVCAYCEIKAGTVIGPSAIIGAGSVIEAGCMIGSETSIACKSRISAGAHIGPKHVNVSKAMVIDGIKGIPRVTVHDCEEAGVVIHSDDLALHNEYRHGITDVETFLEITHEKIMARSENPALTAQETYYVFRKLLMNYCKEINKL